VAEGCAVRLEELAVVGDEAPVAAANEPIAG